LWLLFIHFIIDWFSKFPLLLQQTSEELARIQAERRELFLTAFERVSAEISGTPYAQQVILFGVIMLACCIQ
jgi:hypothetical protein